jgi:DNA-binding response OmpR family regulator
VAKILICDDDPVCREILGQILSIDSHEVVEFNCGTAFLAGYAEHFSQHSAPQAVFLDFMLGDMTGADLLKELHDNVDVSKTALILLSANNHLEMRTIEGEVKPDFFLEKPFVASTVLNALKEYSKV